MTLANSSTSELDQLLVSYRFSVVFLTEYPSDIRFQKVSGLTTRVETETIQEGGENLFVYHLPSKTQSTNLTLQRGRMIFGNNAAFNLKINEMFSSFLFNPVDVLISSLDEHGKPLASWSLEAAYPISWSVSDLDANSNSVIIDTLELAYGMLKNVGI